MTQANDDPLAQQMEVIAALTRLATSLNEFNDKESAPTLSHYRTMPEAVTQSYELLAQGAQLVHGTSTKYTLLGKIDVKEQTKMTQALLNGCQLLATGCLVLHDNQSGCARSTREHSKKAARAIVHTVIQLVEVWVQEAALGENNNLGAQKTGAVWEMCNRIIERQLPKGNRNAMRRDLLTYLRDCAETTTEFQEIVDQGPSLKEEEDDEATSDDGFDDFMGGEDSQYTTKELPVATACLYIIKNSRGCINLCAQFIEAVGDQLAEQKEKGNKEDDDKTKLEIISRLHDYARAVGEGMTDLGASMYPPLQFEALESEAVRQADASQTILDCVADAVIIELPEDVNELLSKLRENLPTRRKEVLAAIKSCNESD